MKKSLLTAILVFVSNVGCGPTMDVRIPDDENRYMEIAKDQGWLESYKKGVEIRQKLAALRPQDQEKADIAIYRGERVAFVGGGAPPGSTNDLMTSGGFYLRVVNKEGKDLRPQSVVWEVLVCGNILQVLPANKIIVIEVAEKDWIVLATG